MSLYDEFKASKSTPLAPGAAPIPATPSLYDSFKQSKAVPQPSLYTSFKGSEAATSTPAIPSPFFYGTSPAGATMGRSDVLDTSGRPLFAYRNPGDTATTTDFTRTATTFDPRVAQPLTHEEYYNPRAVRDLSVLRDALGATHSDDLDHALALAIGGSNQKENLRVLPTSENQKFGKYEEFLANQIKIGKMSYFDAQVAEAKNKGLPVPWTPDVKEHPSFDEWAHRLSENIIANSRGPGESVPQKAPLGGEIRQQNPDNLTTPRKGIYDIPFAGKIFKVTDDMVNDTTQKILDFNKMEADPGSTHLQKAAGTVSTLLNLGSTLAFVAPSALLKATEDVPILGPVAKVVNGLFSTSGEVGGKALSGSVEAALQPIKSHLTEKEYNATLQAADEVGAFLGQLALGGALHEGVKEAKVELKPDFVKARDTIMTNLRKGYEAYQEIPAKQGGFVKNPAAEVPGVYSGETDLTTKVLQRLEGRSTVSSQFISDLTNASDLKQPERDLIRTVLDSYPKGSTIPVKEFADKVKTELLPLDRTYALHGESEGAQYENVTLPEDQRGEVSDYVEHIYESPIKTSAGGVHFNREEAPGYFAHTRVEDLPSTYNVEYKISPGEGVKGLAVMAKDTDGNWRKVGPDFATKEAAEKHIEGLPKAGTRRIIELQSDLFQKGRLEGEIPSGMEARIKTIEDILKESPEKEPEFRSELTRAKRIQSEEQTGIDSRKAEIAKLEPYRNTWQDRIIREEVKQAAKDGKSTLLFPTGETAMKIEGLGGSDNHWLISDPRENYGARSAKPEDLKEGSVLYQSSLNDYVSGGGDQAKWIVTKVGEEGKFAAVPAQSRAAIGSKVIEYEDIKNDPKERNSYRIRLEEQFDISGKVDSTNPIYKFYEKEVGRYLKNNYKATPYTDPQGVTWNKVEIKPEYGTAPVQAFKAGGKKAGYNRPVDEIKKLVYKQIPEKDIQLVFTKDPIQGFADGSYQQSINPKLVPIIKLFEEGGNASAFTALHETAHYVLDTKNGLITTVERAEMLGIAKRNAGSLRKAGKFIEGYRGEKILEELVADEWAKQKAADAGFRGPMKRALEIFDSIVQKITDVYQKVKNALDKEAISTTPAPSAYTPEETAKSEKLNLTGEVDKAIEEKRAIIIDPDNVKVLAGRDYSPENGRMYSHLAELQYDHALTKSKNPIVNLIVGGPGVGKTEMVVDELSKDFDGIIYDAPNSVAGALDRRIAKAEAVGKIPVVKLILGDPLDARAYSLQREIITGRPAPADYHVKTHMAIPEIARHLIKEGVELFIKDVRGMDLETAKEKKWISVTDDPKAALDLVNGVKYDKNTLTQQVNELKLTDQQIKKAQAAKQRAASEGAGEIKPARKSVVQENKGSPQSDFKEVAPPLAPEVAKITSAAELETKIQSALADIGKSKDPAQIEKIMVDNFAMDPREAKRLAPYLTDIKSPRAVRDVIEGFDKVKRGFKNENYPDDIQSRDLELQLRKEALDLNPARKLISQIKDGKVLEMNDTLVSLGFKTLEEANQAYFRYAKDRILYNRGIADLQKAKKSYRESLQRTAEETPLAPEDVPIPKTAYLPGAFKEDAAHLPKLAGEILQQGANRDFVESKALANGQAKSMLKLVTETPKLSVKQKVGMLDYFRTPDRVLNRIGLGSEAEYLKSSYNNYLIELSAHIDVIEDWMKRIPDLAGQERIIDYLEKKIPEKFLMSKEEVVAHEIQTYFRDWADRLGLPYEERISNYFPHIWEKGEIALEFDPETAKAIADKVPGSVYNPFLIKRIGRSGYQRNLFGALEAYVKRATRKANMDPALEVMKEKSEKLELSQFNFVKRYLDAVNQRPTELEDLANNTIKQIVGYRWGDRPALAMTNAARMMISRGALGLNVKNALRNLTQGVNTYSKIGEKYTLIGYTKFLTGQFDRSELANIPAINSNIVEHRVSATPSKIERFDKVLFSLQSATEYLNRVTAYLGAKAKAIAEGKSEYEASRYAEQIVKDTQFSYNAVETPLALRGPIMKTALQFGTYPIKQMEFLVEMAKNKDWAGITRFSLATALTFYTLGKALGLKWQDMLPLGYFGSIGQPPVLQGAKALGEVAKGTTGQQSIPTSAKNAFNAALIFIPGGVQAKRSFTGIQSYLSDDYASGVEQNPLNAITAATLGGKLLVTKTDEIKDKYAKIQDLKSQGKAADAQAIYDALVPADKEIYKKVAAAAEVKETIQNKLKMASVYDRVQALVKDGKQAEAQKIFDSLTAAEKKAYQLVKKARSPGK